MVKEKIILTLINSKEDFVQDYCNLREIGLNSEYSMDKWVCIANEQNQRVSG